MNKQNSTRIDEEIDLHALLGTLIDHKWLIVAFASACFVLSVAYAVLAAPIYKADATIQVEQKVPDLPGLSAITQTLGASDSEDLTEIAIITSRAVIGKAVDDLHLAVSIEPRRFPIIGGYVARHYLPARPGEVAFPWFGLNGYGWGGESLDIVRLDVPEQAYGKPLKLVAGEGGAYVLLDEHGDPLLRGRVGQVATGHGTRIEVKALIANPGMQFEIVRDHDLATTDRMRSDIEVSEQGKDSGIITVTYRNRDAELATQVLDQVTSAYVRQNVEKNAEQAANSLQFVQQQLPVMRGNLDKAQDALNAFQLSSHSVDLSLQTKALLDQEVAIEGSILQLQLQRVDMDRRYTSDHPAYKALSQQIGELESQKSDLDKRVGDLPDAQRSLLRLTEDVAVSNHAYMDLLDQAQQLEIAKAATIGNVRIVDPAAVDVTKPVWPKKILVAIGGALLGALLAIGFIFIRQLFNRSLEDPAVIEQSGLPVYASIPFSRVERTLSTSRPGLLAIMAPADLAVEALRGLRTSLRFAELEASNNVLMISGTSPNIGKSFVAENLAVICSQLGQRVLLIDADMRAGTLHRAIDGRAENGLSELLAGQIDPKTAIRAVPGVEGMDFIARGKVPPNPSELLMHARFSALLRELGQLYDLIIVDTPPVLAVTDAVIVGRHAGTRLLVARFGVTRMRELALTQKRFEQGGVAIKGVIFNAVKKRSNGYSSYGYYEYGLKEH